MQRSGAVRLTDEQRLNWLRLIRSENVGPITFRQLINHLGSAEAALAALPELSMRGGKRRIRVASREAAEAEIDALVRIGAYLVALGEADYPRHLEHIDGPPPLLAVRGDGQVLRGGRLIAIVGSRNASLAGRKIAHQLSRDLAATGYIVVSGLARGIDAAAHKAALNSGTIAVFAGGVDVLYPTENAALLKDLLACGGAVVSEMPVGWQPRARDFPRRNRIIAGLSLGVVLIEAARGSGSLHTARFALEQNRDVFVVPVADHAL